MLQKSYFEENVRRCHSVACVLRDIVEKEFESFVIAILVVLPY